jgi:hypothetical protein
VNTAHYRGDRRDFDPTHFVGTDTAGAFYRPIAVVYDAKTDTTAIQYRPIPPAEMPAFAEDKVRQMHDRARIADLFGGRL